MVTHSVASMVMSPVPAPDPRETVLDIVAMESGTAREKLRDETLIVEDLHLDGDDVADLVERVAATCKIDMTHYRWYHHHGPEGCNPLWLIFPPWWMRKTRIPIRVADLIEGARTGVWPIEYPEAECEE